MSQFFFFSKNTFSNKGQICGCHRWGVWGGGQVGGLGQGERKAPVSSYKMSSGECNAQHGEYN